MSALLGAASALASAATSQSTALTFATLATLAASSVLRPAPHPLSPEGGLPPCPGGGMAWLPDGSPCDIGAGTPRPPNPPPSPVASDTFDRNNPVPQGGVESAMPEAGGKPFTPSLDGYGVAAFPPKQAPPKKRSAHPANGRAGFGMALYMGRLVVFGGEGPEDFKGRVGSGALLNDVWDFDFKSLRWTRWPPLNTTNGFDVPAPRANLSIAVEGDVLVVCCGYGTTSALEDTHAYSFGSGRWKLVHPQGSGLIHPFPRTHHSTWADGAGRVLVYGGVNRQGALSDLLGFNTYTEAWQYVRPTDGALPGVASAAPGGRYGAATCFAAGVSSMYMFGGTRADRRGIHVPTNELFVLDHRGMVWRPILLPPPPTCAEASCSGGLPTMPPERAMSACAFAARLWCFGGRGFGGKVLGDTWVFDPVTLRWAQRVPSPNERTPPARFSHRAVAVSVHRFVVFGGYGVGSNNVTRLLGDVWALDISDESSQGWIQLTETALNTVDVSAGVSGAAPTTKAAQMSLFGGGPAAGLASVLRMIGSGDYAGNDAGSAALGAGQLGPLW